MIDKQPFTIEILGFDRGPVIVDRVIGGSVYFEQAKRIGRRLLSVTDEEAHPQGFRVLSNDGELVYVWPGSDDGEQ